MQKGHPTIKWQDAPHYSRLAVVLFIGGLAILEVLFVAEHVSGLPAGFFPGFAGACTEDIIRIFSTRHVTIYTLTRSTKRSGSFAEVNRGELGLHIYLFHIELLIDI